MVTFLKSYGAALVPLVIIDGIWLTLMSKVFYQKYIGYLMAKHPVWIAIVVFYLLYAAGIAFFVVMPGLAQQLPWYGVLLRGALLGLLAYAAYDLTNQATVTDWPWVVTVVDMAWGSVVTAAASVIAYLIVR